MKAPGCAPDARLVTWADLILACGGQPGPESPSYTALLLDLIQKADQENLSRLRGAYPDVVAAWEEWQAAAPDITAAELREFADAYAEPGWRFPIQARYAYPGAGSPAAQDKARATLTPGRVYAIRQMIVGQSWTYLILDGAGSGWFDSVLFAPVLEPATG